MGFIQTADLENVIESDIQVGPVCEAVNYLNIQRLMKNISRPKVLGQLGAFPYSGQGKITLGRWMPVSDELTLCDVLTAAEQAEAQQIIQELGVWFIQNDTVFYRNDECPKHFTSFGTGDCHCIPPWQR